MKLFIYACVTLEYFNFKRENEFKSFVVYFYCFSNNCCRAATGGNEIGPHPNRPGHSHLFKGSLDLWVHSYFKCLLIPHPKHCGDGVWRMLTLCKRTATQLRLVVTHKQHIDVSNFAGSQILSSIDSIIHYHTSHYWSACIMSMLISIVCVSIC